MKVNQIVQAKETIEGLYKKGDKFRIVKFNKEPELMPLEALHLRTNNVYGFELNELEEIKDERA